MPSKLEPEFETAFNTWKKNPSQEGNAAVLTAIKPLLDGAIATHVGKSNPLIYSSAKRMALEGLRTYDPSRARLSTHLYNHLQGLKRVAGRQAQVVRTPERIVFDRNRLQDATQELTHELGREPTDDELGDHTGFAPKRLARIRQYQPAVAEGTLEDASGQVFGDVAQAGGGNRSLWAESVYDQLDPHHKRIFEMAFGLNGRRPSQNQEIAAKLHRSPGAISQGKARIQALLDEEHELQGLL